MRIQRRDWSIDTRTLQLRDYQTIVRLNRHKPHRHRIRRWLRSLTPRWDLRFAVAAPELVPVRVRGSKWK